MSGSGYPTEAAESMSPPRDSQPSMEDILASIRRIIAADNSGGVGRSGPPRRSEDPAAFGSVAPQQPALEVVESWRFQASPALTETPSIEERADAEVADPEPETAERYASPAQEAYEPVLAEHDEPVSLSAEAEAEKEALPLHQDESQSEPRQSDTSALHERAETLISHSAGASISSSFQALAESVLFRDPEVVERMARETLRPMLKTWLDENLPSMVERLVRAEIERVARGGRSRS